MQNNQQQQDQYGIIPKNDPTQKTIILQDEQGRELTRIQSSSGMRNALRSFSAVQAQQPLTTMPYMIPQMAPMTPLMYQQTPLNFYPDPSKVMFAPTSALPLANQLIIEETDELDAQPSLYRAITANRIEPYPNPKFDEISNKRKIRKKQDDYIYFCSFCERPTNDTCFFCWRIFAFPTWWGATLLGIWLLIVAGLAAAIIALAVT